MFADESLLYEDNEIYGGIFNEWRLKRVKKAEKIFGQEWFQNKKVLEAGCAFGNVGLYFKSLGAEVTFADARQEALDIVRQKDSSVKLLLLNEEEYWFLNREFDLILHFGLMYNLNNWERDLRCTINHGRFIALETAVARFSRNFECKIVQPIYSHEFHGPYSGVGSLVSSSNIEKVFIQLQADYKRYDDSDSNLNEEEFCNNWDEQDEPWEDFEEMPVVNSWWYNPFIGGRRFWIIKNNDID